jgi:hypothetical protein
MKRLLLVLLVLGLFVSSAFAYGYLTNSWVDGWTKYCKYSDGTVIAISYTAQCPIDTSN